MHKSKVSRLKNIEPSKLQMQKRISFILLIAPLIPALQLSDEPWTKVKVHSLPEKKDHIFCPEIQLHWLAL